MVDTSDRVHALRVEKLRTAWDHAAAEVDLHKHRALVFLAVFLTMALTVLAWVATGRLDARLGALLAALTGAGIMYALIVLRSLPRYLHEAARARVVGIDTLIAQEEE